VVMKDGWIQQVGEPLELYTKPTNRFVAGFIGSPAMNFAEVTITEANGALTAESSGFRVLVPPARTGNLKAHKGQRVTLGIRPEDLHMATGADPAGYTFDTVVDVLSEGIATSRGRAGTLLHRDGVVGRGSGDIALDDLARPRRALHEGPGALASCRCQQRTTQHR